MYQKDYILRMIEMIADLIAGILGLIKKGDLDKASATLENSYQDFLKEDASYFRKIPLSKLTDKLLQEHNYTHGHLEILAELFYAEGELAKAKLNKMKAKEFYQKSLKLYEFVIANSNAFSFEKQGKVSKIRGIIDNIS